MRIHRATAAEGAEGHERSAGGATATQAQLNQRERAARNRNTMQLGRNTVHASRLATRTVTRVVTKLDKLNLARAV